MFQNSKNEFLCFLQWLALRVLLGNAGVSTVHTWLEKRERERNCIASCMSIFHGKNDQTV